MHPDLNCSFVVDPDGVGSRVVDFVVIAEQSVALKGVDQHVHCLLQAETWQLWLLKCLTGGLLVVSEAGDDLFYLYSAS